MEVILSSDMSNLDKYSQTITKSIDLMEEAGKNMASIIFDLYKDKKIVVVLGSGGNAGDGLVCARYLKNMGMNVSLFKTSEIKNNDSIINLNRNNCDFISNKADLNDCDVIIDAILGNGLKTPLKGNIASIIAYINSLNKKVVSLDIPSGISSYNGFSMGEYIKSNLCITVEYPKFGLYLNDGLNSYDELMVIKCGMQDPKELDLKLIHLDDISDFKAPIRLKNSNKGSYGKASIIAGSKDYSGASKISYTALESFMMGVGYQRLYVPQSLFDLYVLKYPEIIVGKLSDNNGYISYNEKELDDIIKSSDSIAIGMGMGISEELYKSLKYLLLNYNKRLIIDADALNTISKYGVEILNNHMCDIIITPHPKEFSRLINVEVDEILNEPIKYVSEFSKKYNVVVILKGATSIICDKDNITISNFGTTSLAKGGSGDALSGVICGAMAYLDLNTFDVARFSEMFAGLASKEAESDFEPEALSISMICKYYSNVWKKFK